jgi:hypothetical protein
MRAEGDNDGALKEVELASRMDAGNPQLLRQTAELALDCGHPESTHSSITRGYGTCDGKRYCYDCCRERDLNYMHTHGKISAYLAGDGKTITTWPGLPLLTVTASWQTSAGGFAGDTTITRVQAIADDGSKWYGRGPGRGMYIRLRRAKTK